MSARQNAWARRKKIELRNFLGNICHWINCTETKNLQFDCIQAMGHKHHRCGQSSRASFYLRQYKLGNLQLLCKKHHGIKSVAEHPRVKEQEDDLLNHDTQHHDPF